MRRFGAGLLTLLLLVPAAWALDDKKDNDKPDKKPATPAAEYQAILKEYQAKQQDYTKSMQAAKTQEERQKVFQEKYPRPQEFAPRMLKLAEANAKDVVGFDAAAWLLQNAARGPEAEKATAIIVDNHVENPKVGPVCFTLSRGDSPAAEKLLRGVLEKNKDRDARGMACYALAAMLKTRSEHGDDANKKLSGEALALFDRVEKEFGDVKGGFRNATLASMAQTDAFELRHLQIGKVVPDIEGEDIDGKKFKLSDYRGKVVLLDFWGHW
jgi:hypothetical protein